MIKMFIDNEEVVSDREFAINEEMLSASSTILNNCYPKSWELNKDYISNFYYPKDYSKFLLGEGEYEKGNTEFTILEEKGKNFLDMSYLPSQLLNGVLINNDNGIITFNGTTNAVISLQISTLFHNIEKGKYYFSIFKSGTVNNRTTLLLYGRNNGSGAVELLNVDIRYFDNGVVDINTLYDNYYLWIYTTSNTKFDNLIIKPQLEKGEVQTSFQPYERNLTYNTNVEKKWKSFNIYGNTVQKVSSQLNGDNIFDYDVWYKNKDIITVSNGNLQVNYNSLVLSNPTAVDQYTAGNWHMMPTPTESAIEKLKKFAIRVKPQTQYKISYDNLNLCKNQVFIFYYDKDYKYLNINASNIGAPSRMEYVFTTPANTKYISIRFDNEGYGSDITTLSITNIAIKEGVNGTYSPFVANMPSAKYQSKLISVGYENLLKPDKFNNGTAISIVRGTLDFENDVFVFTATGADMYWGGAVTSGLDYNNGVGQLIEVAEGDIIQLYCSNEEFSKNYISRFDALKKSIGFIGINNNVGSYVIPKGVHYINIRVGVGNSVAGNVYKTKIMVSKTNGLYEYVPYGKYGIEIKNTGKNLFDKNAITPNTSINNANGNTYNDTNSFSTDFIDITGIDNLVWNGKSGGTQTWGAFYNSDKSYNTSILTTGSIIAVPSSVKYVRLGIKNEYLDTLQIESGTQITDYEPYKSNNQLYLLDEPLRAIKGVSDKLYIDDNNALILERNIGVLELTGDKNWTYEYMTNDSWAGARYTIYNIDTEYGSQISPINAMCDYFSDTPNANAYTLYDETLIMRYITGQKSRFDIISSSMGINDVNGFKNWLNEKKPIVNYVLPSKKIEFLGYVDLPYSYEGDNLVQLNAGIETAMELYYYWKNFDVLFAGIVKNTGDISLNPRYPHYCNLQILDYKTFLSESNTLDFVIANKTVKEAINMVVNAVASYGFVVGEINISGADDIIGAYSTLNKSAYDVLQYLANISGSRWRARYVDSSTMAIDFYDPDTLPQAEDIEYTKEYWENNNIVDMTFNYGTRDYRNKQILLSDEVYANINYDETLISNGYSNTFTVQNNIGLVVSVIVNNEEKTIGTNNDKQMGIDADFYYTPGKNIIESNMIYPASTLIHLTYQPLVKGRQIVYNNSEVDRISRQTDTEGVIARYETRNDILSSDELEKIAQTYIEYKGKAEVILTLKTQNKDLYNIGEVVYFNAPIDELKQNYMVKTKQIEYVVINDIINLFYIYEMTSSFNSEKAINYFDNQRNKASGNIADGESITRNIDIETEVGIIWTEGSVSSASVTVTGDNLLNSALNSPFVE